MTHDPIVENVEFLLRNGEWPGRIAARLDTNVETLARTLYRDHRPDLARVFNQHCRAKGKKNATAPSP